MGWEWARPRRGIDEATMLAYRGVDSANNACPPLPVRAKSQATPYATLRARAVRYEGRQHSKKEMN